MTIPRRRFLYRVAALGCPFMPVETSNTALIGSSFEGIAEIRCESDSLQLMMFSTPTDVHNASASRLIEHYPPGRLTETIRAGIVALGRRQIQ